MNAYLREIHEIEAEKATLARLTQLRQWRKNEAPALWREYSAWGPEVYAALTSVSVVFGVPFLSLFTMKRGSGVTEARLLAMAVLHQDLKLSMAIVAKILGKQNASTIFHACHRVKALASWDRIFRARAAKVRELIARERKSQAAVEAQEEAPAEPVRDVRLKAAKVAGAGRAR